MKVYKIISKPFSRILNDFFFFLTRQTTTYDEPGIWYRKILNNKFEAVSIFNNNSFTDIHDDYRVSTKIIFKDGQKKIKKMWLCIFDILLL